MLKYFFEIPSTPVSESDVDHIPTLQAYLRSGCINHFFVGTYHMIVRFVLLISCLLSAALKSRGEEFTYTIVVSEITYSDAEWSKVVDRLRVKYPESAI
ncbi:MAG: hypothetical protein VYB72_09545, partial [Planctomycetota bacterium]|nr:hypothetical protein [Planctomycetota bacterium]